MPKAPRKASCGEPSAHNVDDIHDMPMGQPGTLYLAMKYGRRWMEKTILKRDRGKTLPQPTLTASLPPSSPRTTSVWPVPPNLPGSLAMKSYEDPEVLAMESELEQYHRAADLYRHQKEELRQLQNDLLRANGDDVFDHGSLSQRQQRIRFLERAIEHYEAFDVSRKAAIRTIAMRIKLKLQSSEAMESPLLQPRKETADVHVDASLAIL